MNTLKEGTVMSRLRKKVTSNHHRYKHGLKKKKKKKKCKKAKLKCTAQESGILTRRLLDNTICLNFQLEFSALYENNKKRFPSRAWEGPKNVTLLGCFAPLFQNTLCFHSSWLQTCRWLCRITIFLKPRTLFTHSSHTHSFNFSICSTQ